MQKLNIHFDTLGIDSTKYHKEHFAYRLLERYGIAAADDLISHIVTAIQKNTGSFVRRLSSRRTVWDVTYNTARIRVVYCSKFKLPITAMPKTW